jgi:hypothetical protein
VKYFAVKEPLDPVKNAPLTFEAGRNYTFVVDLSGSGYIDFADVIVTRFNEAFGEDLPNTDITPDPDPALTEAYIPRPHQGFAGSHIYWDKDKLRLTFDDIDVKTHEQYQGLYFKWGSLVGISPAEEGTQVAVYVPTGVNGAYAESTAQAVFSGVWTNVLPGSDRDFSETEAPINGITDLRTSGFVTFLNNDPDNDNLAAYKGDICAYLSGRPGIPAGYWRLPTSAEFQYPSPFTSPGQYTRIVAGEEDGTSPWTKEIVSDKKDGTFVINNGYRLTYGEGKTTFFPASGSREPSNGALAYLGEYGFAWSSSPSGTYGHYLRFDANTIFPAYANVRMSSRPVRCVRK